MSRGSDKSDVMRGDPPSLRQRAPPLASLLASLPTSRLLTSPVPPLAPRLPPSQCAPNVVTFNTLVDVFGKLGQWEKAVGVVDVMKKEVRCGS